MKSKGQGYHHSCHCQVDIKVTVLPFIKTRHAKDNTESAILCTENDTDDKYTKQKHC